MSRPQVEVYVEMVERSKRATLAFFDAVLPDREECRDGYELPEGTVTPTRIHQTVDALLVDLEANPSETYGLYMGATGPGWPTMAMVFFTNDGGSIAGVVVPESAVGPWFERLAECVGGEFGYAVFEGRPPDSHEEFRRWSAQPEPGGPRLVHGVVVGLDESVPILNCT